MEVNGEFLIGLENISQICYVVLMNFISKLCTPVTKTMESTVIIILEHLVNRNSNFDVRNHRICMT